MSDQYPSNSHNPPGARAPRQKQQAIVTNVHVRKKPLLTRIAERGSGIWKDVVMEVIRPYVTDMFADAFHRGVDQAFYYDQPGQSHYRGPRPGSRGQPQNISPAGYVVTDYSAQYQSGAPGPGSFVTTQDSRAKPFDFSQYVFADYGKGREIIDRLYHIVNGYNRATVNDLFELFDMAGDHVGENYGWDGLEALEGINIRRPRGGGGYYLDIPDAKPLKK